MQETAFLERQERKENKDTNVISELGDLFIPFCQLFSCNLQRKTSTLPLNLGLTSFS